MLLSVLFSIFINRKFLFLLTLILFLFVGYMNDYFLIIGFIIFESSSTLYQFNFKRKFNQAIELTFSLLLLTPLFFFPDIEFEKYLIFLFIFSLMKLIYFISMSKLSFPQIAPKYYLTMFRHLTSINVRYFLVIFSLNAFSLILFRVLNQFILLIWSYLRSKTELPFAELVSKNLFTNSYCLFIFILCNLLLVLTYANFLIMPVNIIFLIYIIATIYFLFYEIILYRRKV